MLLYYTHNSYGIAIGCVDIGDMGEIATVFDDRDSLLYFVYTAYCLDIMPFTAYIFSEEQEDFIELTRAEVIKRISCNS